MPARSRRRGFSRPKGKLTTQRIKGIRLASGLVQEDFARALGVRSTTVRNWEIGRYVPNAENVEKLRKVESNQLRVSAYDRRKR